MTAIVRHARKMGRRALRETALARDAATDIFKEGISSGLFLLLGGVAVGGLAVGAAVSAASSASQPSPAPGGTPPAGGTPPPPPTTTTPPSTAAPPAATTPTTTPPTTPPTTATPPSTPTTQPTAPPPATTPQPTAPPPTAPTTTLPTTVGTAPALTDTVTDSAAIALVTAVLDALETPTSGTSLQSLVQTFQTQKATAVTPAISPALRTDGTLDWWTYAWACVFGAALVSAGGSPAQAIITAGTVPVTDPNLTALAQSSLASIIQSGSQAATTLGISASQTMPQQVTAVQTYLGYGKSGSPFPAPGTLDYLTLGLLIAASNSTMFATSLAPPSGTPTSSGPSATDAVTDQGALDLAATALSTLKIGSYSSSATLTANVAAFQTAKGGGATPALRTDGVLDWRTWGLLISMGLIGGAWGTSPTSYMRSAVTAAISDAGIQAFGQAAMTAAASSPYAGNLHITSTASYAANLTALQTAQNYSQYNRSVGVLDYLTLSTLIIAAYDT